MSNKIQLFYRIFFACFCLLCGYFPDPLRFKRFPLTPSFTVQFAMPDARGEKSSAWNGQAATNPTPNLVLVSFHLISGAIRPLQTTPSDSLFSKTQAKTTPKGRVHFHHETRPLKTRLVTLPPLQTKPYGGTSPSLVIDNFWFEPRLPSSLLHSRL